MSRNLWKIFGGLAFAMGLLVFAFSHTSITHLLAATNLPMGTYWNADEGFGDSELKLFEDGHYTNGGIGEVSVEGNYTLGDDHIVFTEFGPHDARVSAHARDVQMERGRSSINAKSRGRQVPNSAV